MEGALKEAAAEEAVGSTIDGPLKDVALSAASIDGAMKDVPLVVSDSQGDDDDVRSKSRLTFPTRKEGTE